MTPDERKPRKKRAAKKPAGKKASPKRSARKPSSKRAAKPKPRADKTQEYQLGDDFLEDLTDGEGQPAPPGDDDAEKTLVQGAGAGPGPGPGPGQETEEHALEDVLPDDEHPDDQHPGDEGHDDEGHDDLDEEEENELEELVNAPTQEWAGLEAAERQGEAEKTFVARASAKITSGFEAIKPQKITSSFKEVGKRIKLPLWLRFLTGSLVIILAIAAATSASLILYLGDIADALQHGNTLKNIDNKLEKVDGGAPETILILGSDKRPEDKSGSFRGLSDTTMLLRVDPDRNAIAVFSLPRDLKVEIPGYGTDKLNAAYAYGGPELTLETIRNLTRTPETPGGLEINHLVNVDFEGFARAVNAINCVYIDVDRRYFHSNDETVDDYEEIDLQPGYQALCGFNALDYARYRHTDNDVVRAARQQDFLQEARAKVPPQKLFEDRHDLIQIFTEHTTSDIDDPETMLQVLKLFIEARNAPVKEIHFEGSLGPSFVTTTQSEINKVVRQFLGIEDTPGARGSSAAPTAPVTPESAPDDTGDTPATKKKGGGNGGDNGSNLVATSYGKELAKTIRARKVKLPIYYPTVLESGSDYAQKPRVYKVNGTGEGAPPDGQRAAYKWVFSRPALGEYYGFQATRWEDPPILDSPSETRTIDDRDYELFYDGDRLKLVAWQTDEGSFWVSNTLIQSLSDREMLDIAKGMRELPKRGG